MKPIVFASFLAATLSAHANLVITEVMAASQHPTLIAPAPDADGDWWELTNAGTTAVDLTGYKWDDTPTPLTPTVSYFPPGVILQPGESIIILEEPSTNVTTWKNAWGLAAETRVMNRTPFTNMGGEGFSGLSLNGDEVNLYNQSGTVVAHVSFGASVAGKSQAFQRDGTPILGQHSVAGKNGAIVSNLTPSDTGSPGDAGLHFTSAPVAYALSNYTYAITAENSGSTEPVISATALPSFLTLTPTAAGTATLASNRPLALADAGSHNIQITATSDVKSTIQEYVLTVLNPVAPIVLNEYNAVSPANFLNGGILQADEDGGTASSDTHFGRIAGNGGQWVEFVVIGDGGKTPVDMRGWAIEIGTNNGSGFIARNKIVLSNHANWQTVPTGTILTFIDRNTAQGGLNSGFALRDRSPTVGDIWTNIWMGDTTYLTYTSLAVNGYNLISGIVSGIVIDNDATQFRVKNNSGAMVFGPAGEGVAPPTGTNSKEVFELEAHPVPTISPLVASTSTGFGYDDGASESTFGHPNNWLNGTTPLTQRFTSLTAPEIVVGQPAGTDIADGGARAFGNVRSGESSSLDFTILNNGTADLTGLTVSVDGTDAGSFTVTANPSAPLSPAGSTAFSVTFAPTGMGAKTATLHIASNDDDEASFDIALTGTGYSFDPEIAVSQPATTDLTDGTASTSLGTVNIGSNSGLTFTISNPGTAPLTGLVITMDGTNAAEFAIIANPAAPVAAGSSTTFAVSFAPTSAGAKTAALHIASNDADETPFDITLTGTGYLPVPEIGVQQPAGSNLTDGSTKKSFGTVKIGKSGTAKTFTIKNTGTANLTGLAITKNGKNSKEFVVTAPLKKALAPGTSTTFKVTFKPKAKGTRSAAIHLKSNDSNENPFDINLTGLGKK
jgi:hypothetical protein